MVKVLPVPVAPKSTSKIGTITYLAWSKNKPVENQTPVNSKTEIQKLQTQLNSLKSKLDNVSDATQKSRLENKLSSIENQLKTLSGQNNSPATIKNLEQEIKKIKQAIEGKDKPNQDNPDRNDDPDEDPEPTNKNKTKAKFVGKSLKDQDGGDFDNYKFLDLGKSGNTINIFYISKNHPQIKQLLSQNKLQKDKQFTVRYGKIDDRCHSPSDEDGSLLTFNENNQDLEIIEVKEPSPVPNPNPQPGNNK
ncbi:3868_t:CDS:2, partial [Funneliformis geosporum]